MQDGRKQSVVQVIITVRDYGLQSLSKLRIGCVRQHMIYHRPNFPEYIAMTIYFYDTTGRYGCFSNFSRHGFELAGVYWVNEEPVYFQAQKFAGTSHVEDIRLAPTPKEAAHRGRTAHPAFAPGLGAGEGRRDADRRAAQI